MLPRQNAATLAKFIDIFKASIAPLLHVCRKEGSSEIIVMISSKLK